MLSESDETADAGRHATTEKCKVRVQVRPIDISDFLVPCFLGQYRSSSSSIRLLEKPNYSKL